MPIVTATLMCHAPIVIPVIGGGRADDCAATTAAMHEAAQHLVSSQPDVLIIGSPHTPRSRGAWNLVDGPIRGDFGAFGHPGVTIDLPAAPDALDRLERAAAAHDVPVRRIAPPDLDHGAGVPLWFLQEAGWSGPTLLFACPWDALDPAAMGAAIADAAGEDRWAMLASGDMSHRLIPGAPAGFHPQAKRFDRTFVDHVTAGDYESAAAIDPALRDLAAEDVVQTTTVAAAAVGWRTDGHRTLAYEGPFGVGYCEAILYDAPEARV